MKSMVVIKEIFPDVKIEYSSLELIEIQVLLYLVQKKILNLCVNKMKRNSSTYCHGPFNTNPDLLKDV
jgi:hypothetical protein